MCGERARCAIDWREGASKKRMANNRKRAKERQEGTRFTAQIVRQCGFVAWGLCGGSFSMCARAEMRGYARGLALGVDSGALCECAARERCGRRLKLIFAGLAGKSAGGVRQGRALSLRGKRTARAAVEAAFRWLGWGIGGRCAGKGRNVRLIGGKAFRRSGWRTIGKWQRRGKRGRASLRILSGGAVSWRGVCAAVHFRCAQE